MKKVNKLFCSSLICLNMASALPIYANEIDAQDIIQEDIVYPKSLEKWAGSRTFTFSSVSVTIYAQAFRYPSGTWSASASVTSGNGTIILATNDQYSSSVYGTVYVNGGTYSYSVRVYSV